MSAREEILARVRSSTRNAVAPPVPAAVAGRAAADISGNLTDLFVERVADYRAVVERCTPEALATRVAAAVAGRVVIAPGLPFDVDGAVLDNALSAAELDAVDTVVTTAAIGIAETGTVVLDHSDGQGRRAISLVPDRHVCVVRTDQIVADVPDAVSRLDPSKPLTWISGPSATSDIELNRVEGVHGPRQLHVIVVG